MAASDPIDDPPPSDAPAAADQPATGDLKAFARDWITIWHSELAAAAMDREAQEAWQTMALQWADAWASAAEAMVAAMPAETPRRGAVRNSARPPNAGTSAARDGADANAAGKSPAGTAAPPRPEAADAAPDPRDAEVARLAERVCELERRLAERDGPAQPNAKGKPRPRPRRPVAGPPMERSSD